MKNLFRFFLIAVIFTFASCINVFMEDIIGPGDKVEAPFVPEPPDVTEPSGGGSSGGGGNEGNNGDEEPGGGGPGEHEPLVTVSIRLAWNNIVVINNGSASIDGDAGHFYINGETIRINYTLSNIREFNCLQFLGVQDKPQPFVTVDDAITGEWIYTVDINDACDGEIVIVAFFIHAEVETTVTFEELEEKTEIFDIDNRIRYLIDFLPSDLVHLSNLNIKSVIFSNVDPDELVAFYHGSGQIYLNNIGVTSVIYILDDGYNYTIVSFILYVVDPDPDPDPPNPDP